MAAPTRTRRRFFTPPVITLIALSFLLGLSEFIVVGILPDIAGGIHVPEVMVGNLVSLFAIIYAPLTPIGSALTARLPRFATHLALVAAFLAGNILCAVAPNYAALCVGRVIIAAASGTILSLSMTYADDVASPEHRTKFIAWVFSGFSIASVAGVPLGTWVADSFGWRRTFWLIDALTGIVIAAMLVSLPKRNARASARAHEVRFFAQFRLFGDRRIQIGTVAMVCGAAAGYTYYTYLTPILRDEIGLPARFVSPALVIYGLACLWSSLTAGKLAARGHGAQPMAGIRPVYALQAILLCTLPLAGLVPIYGALLLIGLGMLMYLQNSAAQVLYMDVAEEAYPSALNLASSMSSTACNIGIAVGSAVGGLANDAFGLTWLGPFGAVFALLAVGAITLLKHTDRIRRRGGAA